MKHLTRVSVLFVIGWLIATPAGAAGPKKLKQPKSFPITITAPGSYVLASNITVPDANTTAISVQADNVTIDLNGFTIQGPVVCTGQPVTSCAPSGSGIGIDGGGHSGLTVRNGLIRGMGGDGASLGTAARFDNVTAKSNGGDGLFSNPGGPASATVISCISDSNGGSGIVLAGGSVYNSTAKFNGSVGISAPVVSGSEAELNAGHGISGFSVVGSTANNNGGTGIAANGAVANSTASSNGARGISAGTATGCFASSNASSPQILATGIAGHNICNSSPCP